MSESLAWPQLFNDPVLCLMFCPGCESKQIWRDGLRYSKCGVVQRYVCRSCGYRFSEFKIEVDVSLQDLPEGLHSECDLLDGGARDFAIKKCADSFSFQGCKYVTSHVSSGDSTIAKNLNILGSYSRNLK